MCTLQQVKFLAVTLGDGGEIFVNQLLARTNICVLCTRLFKFLQLCFSIFLTLLQVTLAVLDEQLFVFNQHFFKLGHVRMTLVFVNTAYQPSSKVDHLFKLLCFDLVAWLKTAQQVSQP